MIVYHSMYRFGAYKQERTFPCLHIGPCMYTYAEVWWSGPLKLTSLKMAYIKSLNIDELLLPFEKV